MKQLPSARQPHRPQRHLAVVRSNLLATPPVRRRQRRQRSPILRPIPPQARPQPGHKSRRSRSQRRRVRSVWRSLSFASILASGLSLLAGHSVGALLANFQARSASPSVQTSYRPTTSTTATTDTTASIATSRPQLSPLPAPKETWECEVAVVGGSLGGVAAAAHAMRSGAVTCLIEVAPWLGGQISAQGVSALDESQAMQADQSFSKSWMDFKELIRRQPVPSLPWSPQVVGKQVAEVNSCWVGQLCFLPQVGAIAAEQWLQQSVSKASGSRWQTSTAFKGAEFDTTGQEITAIYAVHRIPKDSTHKPQGRLSEELLKWYGWDSDDDFDKVPVRLQAPAGKQLLVIDATDTGELVAWAKIPHRLGAESQRTTGETRASAYDNPNCTQAFTYPFALAIHDDRGASKAALSQVQSSYSRQEHRQDFDLQGFPLFNGRSLFNYRRILSTTMSHPSAASPALGDITLVNWNRGNDWGFMEPPLLLTEEQLQATGQYQNWLGGMSVTALQHGEAHALLFAEWLLEKRKSSDLPLMLLTGADAPLGTLSGLSMTPYIREGRRILGRPAYGQQTFLLAEADLRIDSKPQRSFSPTAIAKTHYAIDIHGCRSHYGSITGEATSAATEEHNIRPTEIPIESLIPQGVENLLIGGKGIAVTHIANASTRIHYGEWSIGAAAGATAGWLVKQAPEGITPAQIVPKQLIGQLQQHLKDQGLR